MNYTFDHVTICYQNIKSLSLENSLARYREAENIVFLRYGELKKLIASLCVFTKIEKLKPFYILAYDTSM